MAETVTPPVVTPPVVTPPATTWTDGLTPDLKVFVQDKGFKDPGQVADAYRNLEKLHGVGADKLIRTPDSYTDAAKQQEAWNAIYDRLGRPKEATEYGIENKEDVDGAKFLADTFHKNGLTKTQAQAVAKDFMDKSALTKKTFTENQELMAKQSVDRLKQEWGSGFENNMKLAKQGQNALGWDDKMVDSVAAAIGIDKVLKSLNDAGRRVGEGTIINGNKGDVIHTPDTAQAKIKQLMTDTSFTEKLMSGDAMAKAQWNALHEQLGAGQNYG